MKQALALTFLPFVAAFAVACLLALLSGEPVPSGAAEFWLGIEIFGLWGAALAHALAMSRAIGGWGEMTPTQAYWMAAPVGAGMVMNFHGRPELALTVTHAAVLVATLGILLWGGSRHALVAQKVRV